MKKLRWSVPAGEAIGVVTLSITLGTWPLFDPNWCHKAPYCAIVGVSALTALYFSGKDRWRLEQRQREREIIHARTLHTKTWKMRNEIARVVNDLREGLVTPDTVVRTSSAAFIELFTLTNEFTDLGLQPSEQFKEASSGLSSGQARLTELQLLVFDSELRALRDRLENLFPELLGD